MRCPFLREEQVKSCQVAPFRKSLARSFATGTGERCTSTDHRACPALRESREAHPDATRCPFLRESLVQFCAASPRPTYVPWSESPDLRCAHDGHRFCELFLAAGGESARGAAVPAGDPDGARTEVVDGVPVPGWLLYADNHMWVDVGDDGLCHLGVDAFLTRVVGDVERLAFLAVKGDVRPALVLTAAGVDVTIAFGRHLPLVAANTRLRSALDRLAGDPYGLGWLFCARWDGCAAGLRRGPAAREWMAAESARLSAVVHERLFWPSDGQALSADGGGPAPNFLRHLEREDAVRLCASFFSLPGSERSVP